MFFNSSFAFANIHGPWNNTPLFPPTIKKEKTTENIVERKQVIAKTVGEEKGK